jgi:hypothetical protein
MVARAGRDIWTIRPSGEKGDHSATFLVELATKCILAGSPPGSWVLDPFAGTGGDRLGRGAAWQERDADRVEQSVCSDHPEEPRGQADGTLCDLILGRCHAPPTRPFF